MFVFFLYCFHSCNFNFRHIPVVLVGGWSVFSLRPTQCTAGKEAMKTLSTSAFFSPLMFPSVSNKGWRFSLALLLLLTKKNNNNKKSFYKYIIFYSGGPIVGFHLIFSLHNLATSLYSSQVVCLFFQGGKHSFSPEVLVKAPCSARLVFLSAYLTTCRDGLLLHV